MTDPASPDDHDTEEGLPLGHVVDLGDKSGSYRVAEILRIGKTAELYRARLVRHPAADDVDVPSLVVLKIYRVRPGSGALRLPPGRPLVRPLLRARLGRQVVDVMASAETDLYRWWSNRGDTQRTRRVEPDVVLAMAIAMAGALSLANGDRGNRSGVVHGDVKLGQFLLGPDGIQLTDWDSSIVRSTKPATASTSGEEFETLSVMTTAYTLAYLPQWGLPTRASVRYDAWALLVCWHLLLAGRHPAETYADQPIASQEVIYENVRRGEWAIETDIDKWWHSFLTEQMLCDEGARPTAGDLLTRLLERAARELDPTPSAECPNVRRVIAVASMGDGQSLVVSHDGSGHPSSELRTDTDEHITSWSEARNLFVTNGALHHRFEELAQSATRLEAELAKKEAVVTEVEAILELSRSSQELRDGNEPPSEDMAHDLRTWFAGALTHIEKLRNDLGATQRQLAVTDSQLAEVRTSSTRDHETIDSLFTHGTRSLSAPADQNDQDLRWRCSECGKTGEGQLPRRCDCEGAIIEEQLPGADARQAVERPATPGLAHMQPKTRKRWIFGRESAEWRQDNVAKIKSIRRPSTIVFVNPKGGASKTTSVLAAGLTFGTTLGGGVVAFDNNETRGTLGIRGTRSDHRNTMRQLLGHYQDPDAEDRLLHDFMRSQGEAQFDVLASDERPESTGQIRAEDFSAVHDLLRSAYGLVLVDTGNNLRAENWAEAVSAADLLVVTSTVSEDSGYSGLWMLDALRDAGFTGLKNNTVTVLSDSSPHVDRRLAHDLIEVYGTRTSGVFRIPYDRSLVAGGQVHYDRLSTSTRNSWLEACAGMAEVLATSDLRVPT